MSGHGVGGGAFSLHDPERTDLGEQARALLDAFVSISSDLDTRSVLSRIVAASCDLTDAGHGALVVLGRDAELSDVVTYGTDPAQTSAALLRRGLVDVATLVAGTGWTEQLPALPQNRDCPATHPLSEPLLAVPIRVRGTLFGQLYLTDKSGGRPFDRHDEMLVQSLASVAGIVIENARAYGISERRRRWLEMLGELSELLTPPITLASALERIADALREASGAHSASVVQVPQDGAPFATAVCGEPLELDAEDSLRFDRAVRSVVATGEVAELVVHSDWVAVLAPLRAHLTMPGVVILTHLRLGRPDALDERELLSSFVEQAALALDRTKALEDREQMAVVSDRDRIARDLHDVVIQRLFATGLHLQSIRAAAPTDELRDRIDASVKDLDQTIRDIRSTIFELQTRPRNSVRADVRDVVQEMLPDLGFAPSVQTHGPVDTTIDAQLQQQMASVLREALTNVARHADASSAAVELQLTPTHLRVKVSDDGKGISAERTEFGLRTARRRAVLLGGSLDLWPNHPQGTIFVWSVPVPS